MASEDDGLESYAKIQAAQLNAKLADLTPTADTDCKECGDEIPALRKKAAPWATRCIECETDYMNRHKR